MTALAEKLRSRLLRLHGDQRGELLESLLILGAFVIPVAWLVLPVLWEMLQDYYLSFAYVLGWPFL
jgi:hypothetical protein